MRRLTPVLQFPRFTIPDGDPGGGGGAPSGGGAPASAPSSGAPAGTPSSAPGGSPGSGAPAGSGVPAPSIPGAPAAASPSAFSYAEDRSQWIPPNRLSEVARRAQQFETEARQYRAMLEAGTGVTIPGRPEPMDPETRQAQELFLQVFPQFAPLVQNPKAIERLMAIAEQIQDPAILARLPEAVTAADHSWQQHGRQVLGAIYKDIATDFGVAALEPRRQQAIGREFRAWLEAEPTRVQRYVQADPALTQEFVTDYRTQFIDPFRRAADAGQMQQGSRAAGLPPAPRGGGSGVPQAAGSAPPAARTADQVHDDAWNSFRAARASGQ